MLATSLCIASLDKDWPLMIEGKERHANNKIDLTILFVRIRSKVKTKVCVAFSQHKCAKGIYSVEG